MKDPPRDTLGRFFYRLWKGNRSKISEKRLKMPKNPQKCKKMSTTILSKSSCWFCRSKFRDKNTRKWACDTYQFAFRLILFLLYVFCLLVLCHSDLKTKKAGILPCSFCWSEWISWQEYSQMGLRHISICV